MAVGDAYVFPGFLTPVLTQLFFQKPPTTFLTCFCRGERRKYAGKKSRLNLRSNSQPPGHQSDTLTTEPIGRGTQMLKLKSFTLVTPRSFCSDNHQLTVIYTKRNDSILFASFYMLISHVKKKTRNLFSSFFC